MKTRLAGLVLITMLTLFISESFALATADNDIFILSKDIRSGMRGYCLTTIKGNEIIKLPIEVVSVTGSKSESWNHYPGILIRSDINPAPDNWIGFHDDMSGSPVFINDKLAGAIYGSYQWSSREIARVRSIEEILLIGKRHDNILAINKDNQLKTLLDKRETFDNTTQNNSSSNPSDKSTLWESLKPGDSVAAVRCIGDYTNYVTGNITHITPDGEFYAFGQSVFGRAGSVSAPLVRVGIIEDMTAINRGFQLINPENIIGAIKEDRSAGVFGKLGEIPNMISVNTVINDIIYGRSVTTQTLVVNDERIYPSLIAGAIHHSARKHLDLSGKGTTDVSFEINYRLNGGDIQTFKGQTMYYGINSPSQTVADIREVLNALAENDFNSVSIDDVSVEIFWTSERQTARIASLELLDKSKRKKNDGRFIVKRGEKITLKLIMIPYKRDPLSEIIEIHIDDAFPIGKGVIQARGGYSELPQETDLSKELHKTIDDRINKRVKILDPLPPVGLTDLLDNLQKREPSNVRIIEIITTSKTPPKGDPRFNQIDHDDLDYIIFGFDSIEIEITK